MAKVVSLNDLADVVGLTLVGELGRVNADDNEIVAELRFETLEIGDDVDAVDASVGPEIEQDDLALESLEVERLFNVQPVETGGEFRRRRCPLL